jgi:hypothetical protein
VDEDEIVAEYAAWASSESLNTADREDSGCKRVSSLCVCGLCAVVGRMNKDQMIAGSCLHNIMNNI